MLTQTGMLTPLPPLPLGRSEEKDRSYERRLLLDLSCSVLTDGLVRLTAQISRAASRRRLHLLVRVAQFRGDPYA